MLQLAFDAKRLFHNNTGLGNYSRTLLRNLTEQYPDNDYHLFCPNIKKHPYNLYFRKSPDFQIHIAGQLPAAYWRSYGIKKDLQNQRIDLYHGLSNEIPIGLNGTNIKTIVTIHDLIIKTWPQTFKTIDRAIYDWKFKYACNNANHIVAISESTKRDIIKYYGTAESKISVVYQTCDERFKTLRSASHLQEVKDKYQLPSSYLLYVGSIIARKNLLRLLEAILLLPKPVQIPLVIVGQGKGNYLNKVQEFIQKNQMSSLVYFPKKVRNEDLPAIYQGAEVFCYPSHYEGFGIPILEALYSRIPVVTSSVSSLPEAGGADAFYADPNSADDIASAIQHALTDTELRTKSITKGLEHAQHFDAEKLTAQMMDIYRRQVSNNI